MKIGIAYGQASPSNFMPSINLPSMYLSHVRYSLMSVSVFSCVIFGLFWSISLRSRLFWSISVNYDRVDLKPGVGFWLSCCACIDWSPHTTTIWRPELDPGFYSSTSEPVWSTYYFLRVSNLKISEENSECLIVKSHIEFNLTYSLP